MPLNKFMGKSRFSGSSRDVSEVSSTTGSAEPVDSDDIDEADESGQSILLNIISQLKPGSNLSRITLPTFILEKKSMLERITNQLQHPEIALDAIKDPDELSRFVKVCKWYLSGWHIAPSAVKKPLNPVLGEYFTCYWNLPNRQQAFYIAEQVRHHPPESAYFYMIPESGIRVDGTCIPDSRFLGNSTAAIMDGKSVLQFLDILDKDGNPEKYVLTQPNVYARGILFGKMRLEMGDHMIIKSPSFKVDVEFKTKGFISGTYDAIYGIIKDHNGQEYYEISGKWNDVIYIKDLRDKNSSKQVLFDTHKEVPSKPLVRPLNEQGEYESRRLWKKVTDALARRDHTTATKEKLEVEDYQRELAKKRVEEGVEFEPKLFKPANRGEDLNYYIYKNIPRDASYEDQIRMILELAPILPGQKFTDKFSLPASKKCELSEGRSRTGTPR